MRILAVAATLLLTTSAFAADDAAPKPEKPAKEKKVCKAPERTGSRMSGASICKTKAEWEADRSAVQRDLDKMSRQ